MSMALSDLSEPALEYLKAIWKIADTTDAPATVTSVAQRKKVSPSTASSMIKKLESLGLVEHSPYSAIELTADGRRLAVEMVRRHRLLETHLVLELAYAWDEVQAEARRLAPAVSNTYVERLDARLGRPRFDPHGDPIPASDGTIPSATSLPLTDAAAGSHVVVDRVVDAEPELLRYLALHGVVIGAQARVAARERAAGLIVLELGGEEDAATPVTLGFASARSIRVSFVDRRDVAGSDANPD
jgi:DtxR family Mn-dependent transcriptional regulator